MQGVCGARACARAALRVCTRRCCVARRARAGGWQRGVGRGAGCLRLCRRSQGWKQLVAAGCGCCRLAVLAAPRSVCQLPVPGDLAPCPLLKARAGALPWCGLSVSCPAAGPSLLLPTRSLPRLSGEARAGPRAGSRCSLDGTRKKILRILSWEAGFLIWLSQICRQEWLR